MKHNFGCHWSEVGPQSGAPVCLFWVEALLMYYSALVKHFLAFFFFLYVSAFPNTESSLGCFWAFEKWSPCTLHSLVNGALCSVLRVFSSIMVSWIDVVHSTWASCLLHSDLLSTLPFIGSAVDGHLVLLTVWMTGAACGRDAAARVWGSVFLQGPCIWGHRRFASSPCQAVVAHTWPGSAFVVLLPHPHQHYFVLSSLPFCWFHRSGGVVLWFGFALFIFSLLLVMLAFCVCHGHLDTTSWYSA